MSIYEIADDMKATQVEIGDGASYPDGGPYDLAHLADLILDAHNREIDAIAAQKTAEAHEAFVKNAELADAIAEKDAEIVRLRALVKEMADALETMICNEIVKSSKRRVK